MFQFKTAIVDPPWPYRKVNGTNNELSGYVWNADKTKYYPLMSMDNIKALPIGDLVSDYVFLWAAGPFIFEAKDVLQAWGFEAKSYIVWHKKPGLGVGFWFRGDAEIAVIGVKPHSPSIRTQYSNYAEAGSQYCYEGPRLGHSIKPLFLHDIIEHRFPGPFLEVFGRDLARFYDKEGKPTGDITATLPGRPRPGWTVIGFDALETLDQKIEESCADLLTAGSSAQIRAQDVFNRWQTKHPSLPEKHRTKKEKAKIEEATLEQSCAVRQS